MTMKKRMGRIYIGTSGWHYAHWKGPFYQKTLPEKQFLSHYITKFRTVEINRTFYSLPSPSVFREYRRIAPKGFIFSIKASRFITHVKKLKDPKRPLQRLFHAIGGLGPHLGPILFQLPPGWKINLERLSSFLDALPKHHLYVFELRNQSWLTEATYALLKRYRAAFCIYELDHFLSPEIVTAPFIYVRLHGPKEAYGGRYSSRVLKKWAQTFRQFAKKGMDIYCYFDNDERGYAPINAQELMELI
jgi:uncharacterized protein YecE (DUF72 family)